MSEDYSKLEINHNEKDTVEDSKVSPTDRFNIIYIIFFLVGLVHLMPWTFFTTANKFWMYKFRNTSINETNSEFRTNLQAQFSACVLITLEVSQVTSLILGLLYGGLIKVRTRFILVLTIILTLYVVLTISVKIDTDSWQSAYFALVMVFTAGINSMTSILTMTAFTTLSNFPQRYLDSYLTGTGLSSIFTSLLQIVSLATGFSIQDSALFYFSLGVFVIAFTLLYIILVSGYNKFYLYHMRNYNEDDHKKHITFGQGVHLFKKIWASVIMMAIITFTMNCSVYSLVVSEDEGNGPWGDTYFIPTITCLLSAICDVIGRWSSFRYYPKMPGFAWVMVAVVRMILIPLYLFCNAQPRHHLPVLLPHDYQYIIVTITASVSAGYLVARTQHLIAGWVTSEELKDAYHVYLLLVGIGQAALAVFSTLTVDLL